MNNNSNKNNCDFNLCIFEKNGKCIFDTFSINEYGMCSNCVLIDIDIDILKDMKAKQIKQYCNI